MLKINIMILIIVLMLTCPMAIAQTVFYGEAVELPSNQKEALEKKYTEIQVFRLDKTVINAKLQQKDTTFVELQWNVFFRSVGVNANATEKNKPSQKISIITHEKYFFYFVFFFFPFVTMAQLQQISKTHFEDAKDNYAETIRTLSNGYTLVSYTRHNEQFFDWTTKNPQGVLVLFNEKGKIKWEKNYNSYGVKVISSILPSKNQKEFTIAGGYYDAEKKKERYFDTHKNTSHHKPK